MAAKNLKIGGGGFLFLFFGSYKLIRYAYTIYAFNLSIFKEIGVVN